MNPGLVVKLRPSGPWRIGPDSGARNRVDAVYHSDSLYSAITSAMAQLGWLDAWLEATARNSVPAVCFSSCFPFLEEIGFVIPPRTVWPPTSPALMSARVRWKSARFVPLGIVQAILTGQAPDENHWSVDGASECLVPAGRPGPFRTAVRWNAAVDRLTGTTERHATACIEFRPGSGLWTIVSFAGETALDRWVEPVKSAFRLLADTGFGGERSRGWGRAETPEFIAGILPDMILGSQEPSAAVPEIEVASEPVPPPEPSAETLSGGLEQPPLEAEPVAQAEPLEEPLPAGPEAFTPPSDDATAAPILPAPEPAPAGPVSALAHAHWLLSLYTPAATDSVDWQRGSYSILARGGRVDSPAGSGELKKKLQMVTEGSVLYADSVPCGAASDVAPDGFAHPVFRAGFALAIPLPEVS